MSDVKTARFDGRREVGSIVAELPSTSRVFERFGIDYCCGGKLPVADACAAKGLEVEPVLAALEASVAAKDGSAPDWLQRPVSDLLDHILDTHHVYLRREMPRLQQLMEKVERVHGANHPAVWPELSRLYGRMTWDLDQHMLKEEEVLFPAIRSLEEGGPSRMHCGHISSPIRVMEWEHEEVGRMLARMREITKGYALPEGACNSFRALFSGLSEMEADLHQHIHLENNLVHPRAQQLASPGGTCHAS